MQEHVLASALRVFAEKGYRGATIADIADEVGFTRAALYYYFDSKLDLLDALASRPIEMLLAEAREIADSDRSAVEKVSAFVGSHMSLMALNPDLFTVMIREQMELPPDRIAVLQQLNRSYHMLLAALIRVGIDDRSFQDVDPDLAALHILGALNWTLQWYRPDGRLSLEGVASAYAELSLSGLGTSSAPVGAPDST